MISPSVPFDVSMLSHGHEWNGENLTGWGCSEKLNGCRAVWTGTELLNRSGIPFRHIPDRILKGLPKIVLDGEIHAGRCGYTLAEKAQQGLWADTVVFTVFDAPLCEGDWLARLDFARQHYDDVVEALVVDSTRHAMDLLIEVLDHNGEGLVAREPGIGYVEGRSRSVLKLKSWLPADALGNFQATTA